MDARLSVPRERFADDVAEAAERHRAADLATLDDNQLDAHLTRATELEDFDDLDAVVAEMERRETAATQVSGGDLEAAQWARFDKLLDDGWDEENAVAEVFGKSVERQRRDRVIADLRAEGYSGKGFDELTRKAFRDDVYHRYLAAEGATRGHMLTAEAQRAGIDPHTVRRK